jgi:hypothetical protein
MGSARGSGALTSVTQCTAGTLQRNNMAAVSEDQSAGFLCNTVHRKEALQRAQTNMAAVSEDQEC